MNILILELIITLTSLSASHCDNLFFNSANFIKLTPQRSYQIFFSLLSQIYFWTRVSHEAQVALSMVYSQVWSGSPHFPATISQGDYRCVPSHLIYTILGDWTQHCSLVKSSTRGIPSAPLFCSSMPEFIIHLDGWHLYFNFPDTNYQSHKHCICPNSTTLITDFSKAINPDCPGETRHT